MVIGGGLGLLSLPHWLPAAVVALRARTFARVNGSEAITIPGDLVDAAHFRQVYSHPAATGRSRGAALSDLFWYWLSPGPEIHQEHLEPGRRYDEIARTTRRILALSQRDADRLTARCVARVLDEQDIQRVTAVRLRDLMMPIWAETYYEIVFAERCPRHARDLIVDNANDVVTALKCCGLRHMDTRDRLTRFLTERLRRGRLPHELPAGLSTREQALYLQGTFFNTAVVQMSEAMAHLLMVLAQHPDVQARVAADPADDRLLDNVIAETQRLYPLFGIAHRITSADIDIDGRAEIPAGSVLCFNYPAFHRAGFDRPDRFDPSRWETLSARAANHIPFGVTANRPCPARGLAPVTMRIATRAMLRRFVLHSSATHTRSMPNRGPCLLEPRPGGTDPARLRAARLRAARLRAALLTMRLRDRWEDVWRSLVQLVLGTYMVWDARRQRLCTRYFDAQQPTPAVSLPQRLS
jgi:hypothetical protein